MTILRRYRLYGLEVASAIDLGNLPEGDLSAPADVTIERGAPPSSLVGAHGIDGWLELLPREGLMRLEDVGRFHVVNGERIVVDQTAPGLAALRWRLLGLAFGLVLHQRGLLPLHATVVDVEGEGLALVGASGAGKSTLAAFLGRRGHRLLIDDVCAVSIENRAARAPTGHGLIRLWRDAMTALGDCGGEQLVPTADKFELQGERPMEKIVPLRAMVELVDGPEISLELLAKPDALLRVVANTYFSMVLPAMNRRAENFRQCAQLVECLPAYRFTRPRGFDRMDEVVDVLIARLADAKARSRWIAAPTGA